MNSTYLIQRLKINSHPGTLNPFAFGGGLRNGGLSDDAVKLLSDIFTFDYMGSAEFEFGAIPETLQRMAKNANTLEAFTFNIPLISVPEPYVPGKARVKAPRKTVKQKREESATLGDATIYVLAPKEFHDECVTRITALATNTFKDYLKQGTRLPSALRPGSEWDMAYKGWLELDNGFFFFIDQTMWEKTCELFGVKA